jgi:plasmid stability protein
MGQLLVRGLEDQVIERLKRRADSHHRSLEAELRDILQLAARQVDLSQATELADRIRKKLEGRPHSDSAELIREDRDR